LLLLLFCCCYCCCFVVVVVVEIVAIVVIIIDKFFILFKFLIFNLFKLLEKLSTEYASRLSNILAELLSNDKQLWKE